MTESNGGKKYSKTINLIFNGYEMFGISVGDLVTDKDDE